MTVSQTLFHFKSLFIQLQTIFNTQKYNETQIYMDKSSFHTMNFQNLFENYSLSLYINI